MGREIESIVNILTYYKSLGFNELPAKFIESFLRARKQSYLSLQGATTPVKSRSSIQSAGSMNLKDEIYIEAELEKIKEEVGKCTKCQLSKSRTNPVFGEGNIKARLMFIGEAPGVDEDRQGSPFVGEAGKLLTSLIQKMGFKREEVYITNTVKCHPPNNRDPLEEEVSSCFEYLKKEIEIISPKVIMTLGKVATYVLMGMKGKIKELAISKIRGKVFSYNSIPVVPTFHPAYLLRDRKDKWLTWEDAQEALKYIKNHS